MVSPVWIGSLGSPPMAPGPRPSNESCGTPAVNSCIELLVPDNPDGELLGFGLPPPVHAVTTRATAPARNSRRVGMGQGYPENSKWWIPRATGTLLSDPRLLSSERPNEPRESRVTRGGESRAARARGQNRGVSVYSPKTRRRAS